MAATPGRPRLGRAGRIDTIAAADLAADAGHAAEALRSIVPAAGGTAGDRSEARPGRPVPGLRRRCDVPRDQCGDGPGPPAERLRGCDPAGPGVLRCDP